MLAVLDWVVIAAYLLLSLGIGLYYTRKAGSSLDEYFLSGRDTSWWLAGLSMVATTFAADTPLAVTEMVRGGGISQNWLWWNMLLGGMLTTYFFARLWRRANVTTDLEFITLRYSGREAHWLRGFKAVYLGILLNAVIIGWVNLAMAAILQVFFGLDPQTALLYTALCMLLTTAYASLSGLRGVLVTDAVQFCLAMGGCIVLAILVIQSPQVGGMTGLIAKVPPASLNFLPVIGADNSAQGLVLGLGAFVAFAGVQWWASWYPGSEPGGGGYVVQRILSAKSESHGLAATLFFQLAHYALRPWPWILVALATLVLYPNIPAADQKLAYIYTIRDFLPVGLKGLLLVSFFAAYMSTISSQLNWGTSYLVNDLYRAYIAPNRSEKAYVNAGRIGTVVMMAVSLWVTTQLDSVAGAWQFLMECGAGMGLVLILRWYWWRVSAWSEIAGTIAPALTYGSIVILREVFPQADWLLFPGSFFLTVGVTTLVWIAVTYLAPTTDTQTLQDFYNRVQPQGVWGPFRNPAFDSQHTPLWALGLCWAGSVVMVYGFLFTVGKFLFQDYTTASLLLLMTIASGAGVYALARRYPVFR